MRRAVLLLVFACGSRDAPPRAPATTPVGIMPAPIVPEVAVTPVEAPPLGPLPPDVHPRHESLTLAIDPAAERFSGTAELELELERPRTAIWLHGRGLHVASIRAEPGGTATWTEVDPIGVARIDLARPVSGTVRLVIAYDAAYDPQLVGAYRSKVGSAYGVFSKFEAIYARRAFPCFDEPAFKIPFDLTLRVPDGAVAIGNMPVADTTHEGDHTVVRFQTTPPLPVYLVAFAVAPLDVRSTTLAASALRPSALPIGGVAWQGRGDNTKVALAGAPELIAEEERYFDIAFPYPKIDLVAVPDFQSGAMENAGAITFRESLLLVDDKIAGFRDRLAVLTVMAHELAHQWFGDLVTMRWWDDLWLNEGFATFMAARTLAAVRPELEVELSSIANANRVMTADSLASARRIRQPIATAHDITNAFDGITYEKGAAVLRMLEHYLGEEPFRRGVHAFLTAHATGNATTDDLVRALSQESGKDVAAIAASFLDEPGVPALDVHVSCTRDHARVELAQHRWSPLGASLPASAPWHVPVCVRAGIAGKVEEACTVMTEPTAAIELAACPAWVMPNAQAAGYYRFSLAPEDLTHLRERGMTFLTTGERLAFALDLDAALSDGALPAGDVLRSLEPLARQPHGTVAAAPLDTFVTTLDTIVDPALRPVLAHRVAALYAATARDLGWKTAFHEMPWRRELRTRLLGTLALDLEDRATLDEAARLGRRYLGIGTPAAPDAVDPDMLGVALASAARRGDAAVFDALVARLIASEDGQLRGRILRALGNVRAPALVDRALALALDPRLRPGERLSTITPLLSAVETSTVAWQWLRAHFDELAPQLPDRYAGRLPLVIAACDAARADDMRAFFGPRAESYTGMPRNLAQALESVEQCAARTAAQRSSADAYARGR